MTSNSLSVNHRMQRTATLAQEVLERAKSRKLNWPIPGQLQRRTFREGDGEDACFAAAFASVAEHMGHISAACENYYCCVSPLQFKECEVAHIFRYHSRQASENLLKAFENEESKHGPIVEEPGCPDTESSALVPAKTSDTKESKHDPIVEEPGCPDTEPSALVPAKTSDTKDIYVEVSPGTYSVSASLHEDGIKQTHLLKIKPGESVNLTFDF
ncbi:A-kinase-interacting protein 1 [Anolis carolinensis]|uniref:A-kinase-interacting protein 1 n=1 Tax=Anolis carolinensis TaxID=28377 RepID=UPI000462B88D|nr:PREDICTED: A-kinase-interacting protein 1 [Anolis carolinensis]|eukprot:XP_008105321.1 PREDICTED: A-kinase-interacting protein 1 [Anolis carolinensis]